MYVIAVGRTKNVTTVLFYGNMLKNVDGLLGHLFCRQYVVEAHLFLGDTG